MEETEYVIIDLTRAADRDEIYAEVYSKLKCRECGKNLDALWDVLTGMEIELEKVYILRMNDYGDPVITDYVGKVCEVFTLAEQEYGDFEAFVFRPEEKVELEKDIGW